MSQTIHAVFENGVFHPTEKVILPEHLEVEITIQENSETEGIARVAEESGAFDYLSDSQEDIYTIHDGEPV
jgi:predicted DNA-binding antitoxin AbrB/MazE fold protein